MEPILPLHYVNQPREEQADEVSVPPRLQGLKEPPRDERRHQRAGHEVLEQILLPLLPYKILPHVCKTFKTQ